MLGVRPPPPHGRTISRKTIGGVELDRLSDRTGVSQGVFGDRHRQLGNHLRSAAFHSGSGGRGDHLPFGAGGRFAGRCLASLRSR